jgi:predicted regulator of Ras-like GTPase activity (Roadblock/LC7/MglB family)
MPFRETLQSMVENVGGGIGAMIMGYDGIAIDEYLVTDVNYDMPLLAVEYSNLLKDIKQTVDVLPGGLMQEVSFSTALLRVVARPITDEFFLMLVLEKDGNFGKARFLLRRDAPRFIDALS